jgi:hypothetical protein
MNAMRYTGGGRSTDEAIAGILPSIQERLKDVEQQDGNQDNTQTNQPRDDGEASPSERSVHESSGSEERDSEESVGTDSDEVIPDESSYTQPSDDGSARGNIQISPSRSSRNSR